MNAFGTPSPLRWSLLLLLVLLPSAAYAQVTGVSYTAAPVGLRTYFDGNAGLSDSYFYGGALGFGFGEFLEVSGEYLVSYDAKTDFSRFDSPVRPLLEALPARDVSVTRYGGQLRLNVGRSGLLPFVSAGTGILRFKPDGVDETESIYLTAGGGITLGFQGRYTFTIEASRMGYRYSPFATFALGNDAFDERDFPIRTVYNTNVRASLLLYLGGRARGEMSDVDRAIEAQLAGRPRLFVQPFYGRIDFNRRLGNFPKEQPVSGVNAGVDLGPYVGLRGFYWRATAEDKLFEKSPIKFRDMQFYGGELNMRFASTALGAGLTPYLTLGGGYMRVGDDYEAQGVFLPPDSRFFASGGAGLDVPLSQHFRVQVGARGLLMSDQELNDVASPSSVHASWMYSAGVEFSLGGGPSAREVAAAEIRQRERERSAAELEIERLRSERAQLRTDLASTASQYESASAEERAEIARLQQEIAMLRQQTPPVNTVYVEGADGTVQPVPQPVPAQPLTPQQQYQMAQTPTSNLSGQTIAMPVPNVGEIYVRFGDTVGQTTVDTYTAPLVVNEDGTVVPQAVQPRPPVGMPASGLTSEQIQQLVRQTIQTELQQANGQALSQDQIQTAVRSAIEQQLSTLADNNAAAADLAAMQRIETRLAEMEARLERRMLLLENRPEPQVTVVDRTAPPVVVPQTRPGLLGGRRFYTAYPYLGFRAGEGANQFLFGARAEYAPPSGSGFRFAPEAAFGFGDGTSFQLFSNIIFPFGGDRYVGGFHPYAGAGLGVVSRKGLRGLDLGLNLLIGGNYQFGPGAFVVEYSAPNFFDYHRFLIGYRLAW